MLFYYHYNLIHFYRLKKSLAPPREYSGYEYELYHVNKLHITCYCARWVCDLPSAFCRFLRSGWLAVAFLKFSLKKEAFSGQNTLSQDW